MHPLTAQPQIAELVERYRGERPWSTLLALYRGDRSRLALSLVFYVIKHSPVWILPVVVADIVDVLATDRSLGTLWPEVALFAFAVVQNIPTHWLHIRFLSLATHRMEARLRLAVAWKLQQLTIGFYERSVSGGLHSKILRDVEAIEQLTSQVFQLIPAAALTVIVAVGVVAARAPGFVVVFLVAVPILLALVARLNRAARRRTRHLRERMEALSARLFEMLQLVPLTRAHGLEAAALARTADLVGGVEHSAVRVDEVNALTGASTWVTFRLFHLACLLAAAALASGRQFGLTPGDVILLGSYFDALTGAVSQLMNVLPQLNRGFEAIRSVGEILECDEVEANAGKPAVEQVAGAFVFEHVHFAHGADSRHALVDFSLSVAPGETIAVVGPSGAGKTTLLTLIAGFVRPQRGRILLDGRDLAAVDLRSYRRHLAVVSQQTVLFEGSVRDNLAYGSDHVDDDALWNALVDANATEFVAALRTGLDTTIGENGVRLSGGQRQRLAIARALVRRPRVLLLDEATSALDSASEAAVQEALDRLMVGRTTFVVAHRLSTVRRADRIVVLDAGRLVEVGDHRDLLERGGLYARLHALQG